MLQQLSQAGFSQQVGSAAQQAGSAAQQAGSQAGFSQHDGSQQLDWQQLFLQQLWQANKPFRPPNRLQHFFLWQQPVSQQLSQADASQQDGSAAQQAGSSAAAQVGSAAAQAGSAAQQAGSKHLSQHDDSQQLLQPPHPPER